MLMKDKTQWGLTADVVVVGFGAAGAVAAITAHDKGATVLILEKQPASNHMNNSSMSAGVIICPNNIAAATQYMEHLCRVDSGLYWTDKKTLRIWARYASQNKEWLEGLGGKVKLYRVGGEHNLPGTQSIERYRFAGLGPRFMDFLKSQVESRGIQVLYGTPAERLLTSTGEEVIGVKALSNGEHLNVRASKAVIMAPGGFEFDEEMKLNYLKVYPTYFMGSPADTGDGVRMVQEVGACLWHMNCCSASFVLKFPEFPIAFGPNFGGAQQMTLKGDSQITSGSRCGFIIVDKYGRRYTNEDFKIHVVYYELAHYDSQNLEYPRVPSYWIFDRKRMEAGPLPVRWGGPMLFHLYNWSRYNKQELDKGWIIQGDDIKDLADKLEMNPAVLEKTIEDYNSYCKKKEDPEFHRLAQHLTPLSEFPLFAVKLWPGSASTLGGPRRNHKAQILNAYMAPIPRLYGAGEFGSIFGMLYPASGGYLSECIAFGRIAGENAADEHPL